MKREISLPHGHSPLQIGKRTLVMGILNVTPDSFSDGGRYNTIEYAVKHAKRLEAEGADLLDIGGESTRPDSIPVSLEEELKRVIPVIEALKGQVKLPISVDTYKAEVATKAIEAGAHIINDVWGAKADPDMASVAAETGAPIILMHNRQVRDYRSFMSDVIQDLKDSIDLVKSKGVNQNQIILDPGIGFAKDYEENLTVMAHLEEIVNIGYPVLLGTSRKSMIGKTLDLPVNERLEGSLATVVLGIQMGVDIVRVHDVKETVRAVKMTDAILRRRNRG